MSYRSLPIGNLSNTNITFGSGIQSDASFSYVTVNCDPKLVLPRTSVTDPVNPTRSNPKRYEGDLDIAGKIAVESDVCNLEVANLKVTGTLILTGPAVFKSCVVIEEDGALCCPLTVRNTNVLDPQEGNALCVEGSTVMIPLTNPATNATGQALLFLDGTQADVLLTNDYMLIDARALSSGIGIDINLDSDNATTLVPMTGTGINVLKTGSSMTDDAGSRLLLINAPTENGSDPTTNAITLVEVSGAGLTDFSSGGDDPPGFTGIRKTALWVDCTPPSLNQFAPVMGFLVDGGTTFRGRDTTGGVPINGNSHGHVHVAQETTPKMFLVDEGGAVIPVTDENNTVFPNSQGTFTFPTNPNDQFGTDVAGSIQVTLSAAITSPFYIQVNFHTSFPEHCVPSINITPESKFVTSFLAGGLPVTVFQDAAAAPFSLPRNAGFVIGPLTNSGGVGVIHYHVLGVIKA